MRSRYRILLLSLSAGLGVWIIDSVLDCYIFYEGRFTDLLLFDIPHHEIYIRVVILVAFVAFGLFLSRLVAQAERARDENRRLVGELQAAMADIKKLSGFLPICAACKKIRDDQGYWKQIETYIQEHSEAEFSHGICPECAQRLYPDLHAEIGRGLHATD